MSREKTKLDINMDLKEKINSLDPNIAFLANEVLADIEKGKTENQIKEFIRDEITEIVKEEIR
ncbi:MULTISPECIES: CxC ATPase DNA modification system associated small protein [Clostridium]|jgi:hypothetical protein|uniref:Uncharacterized protein n=1 Tax=Clostridium septicum TaxID=1504 RepID=A0A9N7PKP4_CLOSE|nr:MULTISPECIES: CxC ATPase DNA modification system associated small protein [Clostridium]AYE34272.1 hypothetical protein CP523_07315 [Clostridium septicum]MBS5306976.1 hypothetical protein [Clostridium sp.]MDB1939824.1 hypothetical protein [Clostridium tertium]MDB1944876.1 hypothetical protein [Clostridium tertium]MDB1952529.1 hypothetical protein [Clostridium tertium]